MTTIKKKSAAITTTDHQPLLVSAKPIAKALSCSVRYVHLLHEAGEIPGYRFGKACIRYNMAEVLKALKITVGGVN